MTTHTLKEKSSRTFNSRFFIKKRLSAGSFGVVFLCTDSVTQGYAALKIEKDEGDNLMSLERETSILDALQGLNGIPKMLWYGFEHGYNCMALQLLGKDLAYHLKVHRRFTLKCVCNIADQMISMIELIHRKNVIHRDIKPENILTGLETDQNCLYIVDFGISKFYRESDGNHIPFKENKPFIGTTRYASMGAHKGYELSRRDDLESLCYVLIYLLKGQLPWQNIVTNNDKEKTKLVGQMKMQLEISELCKDLPPELSKFLEYSRKLSFKNSPDYKYLQSLILRIAQNYGFTIDKKFDWTEQGTTTTKSIDTYRKRDNSKKPNHSKQPSNSKQQSQLSNIPWGTNKRGSDFSAGDLLRLPSKMRQDNRRKSFGENNESDSNKDSHQSSICLNYVPSLYKQQLNHFQSSKLVCQHVSSRATIKRDTVESFNMKKYESIEFKHQNLQKQAFSTLYENILFNQQENFQDLEALEERLKKDNKQSKVIFSQKHMIVKEIQKQEMKKEFLPLNDHSTYTNAEDMMDDDPQLQVKLQSLSIPIKKMFKENLAKK